MDARAPFLAALLLALAGCSGSGGGGGDEPAATDDFGDLDLDATEDTGVIRGVVVDERIVPIPDAEVSLALDGGPRSATTDSQGRFGFDDIPAGTYFMRVGKLNHKDVQASVEVQAGVDDPPVQRILLERLFAVDPYSQVVKFEGFIQCGYDTGLVSSLCLNDYETLVVPDIPPTLKELFDNRGFTSALDPAWQTVVIELTWEPSATGTSQEMFVLTSFWNRTASHWFGQTGGPPPVVLSRFDVNESYAGSQQGDPAMIPPEGLSDLYTFAGIQGDPVAVGVSQDFTILQHNFFYGQPPENWSFLAGDEPPF